MRLKIDESSMLNEDYGIPKKTYEYILKKFMYPNYNNVPSGTIYHNTHLESVDSIAHKGLLISSAKQLEYDGNMTWATTVPNQKGYGGCTIAFTLDGLDNKDYEMVNDSEYCIYYDIPTKNFIFIDLPVSGNAGGGIYRLSDIPKLIDKFGLDKVKNVISKSKYQYIPIDDILPYL